MNARLRILPLAVLFLAASAVAQPADDTYRMPPKEIADLVDAPAVPIPNVSPDAKRVVMMEPPALLTIADLASPELKLAGVRFNPETHDQPRAGYFRKLTIVQVADGRKVDVTGIPADARMRHVTWSPDGQHLAFTLSTDEGLELWIAGIDGVAHRIPDLHLNDTVPGSPLAWLAGGSSLVVRAVPAMAASSPKMSRIPRGPVVQQTAGRKAAARTYQDLLKSPADADLFEYHAQSVVVLVPLDGPRSTIVPSRIVLSAAPSPDGRYVVVTSLHRPFSFLEPLQHFPTLIEIWTADGKLVRQIADLPLAETIPVDFDAVRTGPRAVEWRADKPATLFWAEAQDEGNPRKDVPVRDRLFTLAAPFEGQPSLLASLPIRFDEVLWGSDDLALVTMARFKDRHTETILIRPGKPDAAPRKIFDRSTEDRYGDPGRPALRSTSSGTEVLRTSDDGRAIFLEGGGASSEGDRPFVDRFDLTTLVSTRLWRSAAPAYESPLEILDAKGSVLLTRRETVSEPPNLVVRDVRRGTVRPITSFANPMPQLASATREIIHYKRADGLDLSGTLYLPAGYDAHRDGPLPVLMWAYPLDFKSAKAAGQVSGSPYRFTRAIWASPLFFLVRGYAVLDNPAIPIVGEGDRQPNDTYVEQLVAGAKAAVDELVRRGVGDRDRMAIGGHSYGAFMTANLLAHSDLFRAGIARSGAYNRTLTPFSFQAEERSFWEAPDTYMNMSPFRYADRINEPLLMIHGIDDDNTGTFPIQSERLYQAIQGLGGTARLVMLPYEAHGYRARESVMDMLAEMDGWLEKYVRNAKPRQASGERSTIQ